MSPFFKQVADGPRTYPVRRRRLPRRRLQTTVPSPLWGKINRMAETEGRSLADMAERLLDEALTNRRPTK